LSQPELIDSHCHLDFKHFDKDRREVMERARASGVIMMINSGVDLASNQRSLELAREHDFVYPTLGLSPNLLDGLGTRDIQRVLDQIREHAGEAVGIGEAGLDYYRCRDGAGRERQVQAFRQVADIARGLDLPLVIHSRDAENLALEMVMDLEKVVFHCYGGSLGTMKQAVERGFYISLATIVCRSAKHQVLARNVPLDRLLLETDSPYLSPRQGRNEPSYLIDSVGLIARMRGLPPSEIARMASENTRRIFPIP
jgi:TatD DNase family protein